MRRDVFQALADPTRRDILRMVARQPLTPNAVADRFDVSRQAISKHIKMLTECGLIDIRQQGRERICSIQPQKLDDVSNWLSDFKKIWDSRFEQLDHLLDNLQTTDHQNIKKDDKKQY